MKTDIFEKLRIKYGSHSAVARKLGIDRRTYRRWRNRYQKLDNVNLIALESILKK